MNDLLADLMSADGRPDEPKDERQGERRQGSDPNGAPIHGPCFRGDATRGYHHIVLLNIDAMRAARYNASLLKTVRHESLQRKDHDCRRNCRVTSREYETMNCGGPSAHTTGRKACAGQDKSSVPLPLGGTLAENARLQMLLGRTCPPRRQENRTIG